MATIVPDSIRVLKPLRGWKRPARPAVVVAPNGCWVWQGGKTPGGYGQRDKRVIHVLVYEEVVGPVPAGLDLDHLCRNRACCNPEHLEPVTRQENLLRGINAGETHHAAKLSDEAVREIRAAYGAGGVTMQELGARYGVTKQAVWHVVHNLIRRDR